MTAVAAVTGRLPRGPSDHDQEAVGGRPLARQTLTVTLVAGACPADLVAAAASNPAAGPVMCRRQRFLNWVCQIVW
jgi:hypothetical protein